MTVDKLLGKSERFNAEEELRNRLCARTANKDQFRFRQLLAGNHRNVMDFRNKSMARESDTLCEGLIAAGEKYRRRTGLRDLARLIGQARGGGVIGCHGARLGARNLEERRRLEGGGDGACVELIQR